MKRRSQQVQVTDLDDVDDNEERQKRARTALAFRDAPVKQTLRLDPSQLAEHYANCMKLSAENKISIKNAFSLHIIDYMAEMVAKKSAGIENFQAASCILDVSAKIYGYRVDVLYSEAHKLAQGVGQRDEAAASSVEASDPTVEPEPTKEPATPSKRVRMPNITIEKNLNNISLSKLKMAPDVDPLFKKTSAQFNEGNTRGIFLSNIQMRDDSSMLLYDPKAVQFPPEKKGVDMTSIGNQFPWPKFNRTKLLDEKTVISPELSSFKFGDNSPFEKLVYYTPMADTHSTSIRNSSFVERDFDDTTYYERCQEDDFFAMNDVQFMESSSSPGARPFFFNGSFLSNVGQIFSKVVETDTQQLKNQLATVPSEYSYFKPGTARLEVISSPKSKPLKKKRKRRDSSETSPHDFMNYYNNEFSEETLSFNQVCDRMSSPLASASLLPKTTESWSEDKHIIKDEFCNELFSTYYHCDFKTEEPAQPVNPVADEGDLAVYEEVFQHNFSECTTELYSLHNPNLLSVSKFILPQHAKNIDMRKLKAIELDLISNHFGGRLLKSSLNARTGSKSSLSFKALYKRVETCEDATPQMSKNLSVPLALVALLHLSSDHNLILQSTPDLSDFYIHKDIEN